MNEFEREVMKRLAPEGKVITSFSFTTSQSDSSLKKGEYIINAAYGESYEKHRCQGFVSMYVKEDLKTKEKTYSFSNDFKEKGTYILNNPTIKQIRAKMGLTQKQAAEKCGVPYRTYQNWENEYRNPPEYVKIEVLKKLSGGS